MKELEEKPKTCVVVKKLGGPKLMATCRAGRAVVPLKAACLMACVPGHCKDYQFPGAFPWVFQGRAWQPPEDRGRPKLWKVGPQVGSWLSRAVGSWRQALLQCH